MQHLPAYLWAITYLTVAGMAGATSYVLYRGAQSARLGRRAAITIGAGSIVVFGGWLAASSVIAGQGRYHTHLGHGVPWLPVAVLGFFGTLMALTRIPAVARTLDSPGMLPRLLLPHSFRIEGVVFIVALILGHLPALFAVPAGIGDITVGLATPWVTRKLLDGTGERSALWFNLFGIVDLIDALGLGGLTGFNVISVHPAASLNGELPLALVPTVGVPLLMVLHIRSLVLLRRQVVLRRTLPLNAEPLAA